MPVSITNKPIGQYYSWLKAKQTNWTWRDIEPVVKTWKTFIPLSWAADGSENIAFQHQHLKSFLKDTRGNLKVGESDPYFAFSAHIRRSLLFSEKRFNHVAFDSARETVSVIEKSVRQSQKAILRDINVKERLVNDVDIFINQAFKFVEVNEQLITFIRDFKEKVHFVEETNKDVLTENKELLSFEPEYMTFGVGIELKQSIKFLSEFKRIWQINLLCIDTFEIIDNKKRFFDKNLYQTIDIDEGKYWDLYKKFDRSIRILEKFTKTASFNKFIEEKFDISRGEAVKKLFTLPLKEQFVLFDDFLKGGGEGTFSDFSFLSEAIDDSEFEEMLTQSSPDGYGPFAPFIPGDYEYKSALIKIVMRSRDLSRPYINQIRYEVDLPDLFDNGVATLSAKRTRIPFNKKFNPNEPPALSVSVKSGATKFVPAVDFDIQPDNQSFEVELRNPSNGTLVAGKITWRAQGY